jgi:hypothetical protein
VTLVRSAVVIGVAQAGIFSAAVTVMAQALNDVQTSDTPLVLKAQGSFFVGGDKIDQTRGEVGDLAPGGHIAVNQMYVRYMVPQGGDGNVPVVMVHGATLTGKSWETTPDGRMGWDEYFVRKGHPVYVPDQIGRGRSGFNQAVFNNVRAGSTPPANQPVWLRFSDEVVWPNFRVGPIIWQVVKNLLTKAVTAPFRALASLFKGAEKAQFVDFAPGDAALDPEVAERLAGLGRTLAPKGDLRVDVPYGALAESDAAALTAQRYDAELGTAMERTFAPARAAAGTQAPAFDALLPGQQLAVLTSLVRRLTGAPPQLPPPPPQFAIGTRKRPSAASRETRRRRLREVCSRRSSF